MTFGVERFSELQKAVYRGKVWDYYVNHAKGFASASAFAAFFTLLWMVQHFQFEPEHVEPLVEKFLDNFLEEMKISEKTSLFFGNGDVFDPFLDKEDLLPEDFLTFHEFNVLATEFLENVVERFKGKIAELEKIGEFINSFGQNDANGYHDLKAKIDELYQSEVPNIIDDHSAEAQNIKDFLDRVFGEEDELDAENPDFSKFLGDAQDYYSKKKFSEVD